MTRRRWIADEFSDNRAAITGDHATHLSRVLRAQTGQEFDISTGDTVRRGRVTLVHQDRVEFELGETVAAGSPSGITLALAIFKFDRMEWAIEKCTELGVSRIVPTITQRAESHLAAASHRRVDRWQRIALQAAEQSRQLSPPQISEPAKLSDVVALAADQRIVLAESEQELMLKDALIPDVDQTILAIGPEGGWADTELEQFHAATWKSASLGSTILRAETAAIAATAIVLSVLNSSK